jgi:hypothetical protein
VDAPETPERALPGRAGAPIGGPGATPEAASRAADVTARRGLAARLLAYQAERFPIAGYVPLIAAFTFCSVAYSRLARGAPGFVPLHHLAMGTATALVLFFLLRVLDEHKDADVDAAHRPELPVPRGLVTLAELRRVAIVATVAVLGWNAVAAPVLLGPLALFALWAALMTREFFVRDWLRRRAAIYLVTHMAIMPFIDLYTTGVDWLVAGGDDRPVRALSLFLMVTFLNGIVIEIGRKLRAPEDERPGVDTYTGAWGVRRAPVVWALALAGSTVTAVLALRLVSDRATLPVVLAAVAALCAAPALAFLARPERAWARRAETASQLWPLATYLALGAGPFVERRFLP